MDSESKTKKPIGGRVVPMRRRHCVATGWLMFDPDHPSHLGVFRSTLWECHPNTKIEVWQNGAWVDLGEPAGSDTPQRGTGF